MPKKSHGSSSDSALMLKRMTETPIPKLILSMATPTVISMLITVVYNTADTYFVSQINKSASAAVGAVYPIMAVIQAVGYGLGVGSSSLISILLGQKNKKKADMYASSAFYFGIVLGLLVCVVGLLLNNWVLNVLGCSETMLEYAKSYSFYILLAAPISCSTFVMNNTVRAQGNAGIAMVGMSAGAIVNMILDPVLIFTCNMGTGGASLATAISQLISFLIFAYVFISKKSIVDISIKNISKNPKDYLHVLATGLPTIFRQSMGSLSAALLNIQAVVYGDAAVSAVTIANKVYVLVRNVVLGVGQGFMPVAGYNFGAGNRKRTWNAFLFTSLLGTVICLVCAAGSFFMAENIMRWFSPDSDVVKIGITTLHFCAAVMPFMAISTYVNQMYQCLGFKTVATLLASCRQGIMFVPAILILPKFFGCTGVEASQPLADLLTFVISVPFLILFYVNHIKQKK